MIKVLDKALEKKVGEVIKESKKEDAAPQIIQLLKGLQDSSGIKLCTAVTAEDSMYREVK